MPPVALEYQGRDVAARFFASVRRPGRTYDLVPTRARAPAGGIRRGVGLEVLTLTGDRICALTRFESGVLPWFGLPRSLPENFPGP